MFDSAEHCRPRLKLLGKLHGMSPPALLDLSKLGARILSKPMSISVGQPYSSPSHIGFNAHHTHITQFQYHVVVGLIMACLCMVQRMTENGAMCSHCGWELSGSVDALCGQIDCFSNNAALAAKHFHLVFAHTTLWCGTPLCLRWCY